MELDKLRPEVRKAIHEVDGYCMENVQYGPTDAIRTIRAEVLRLADENTRLIAANRDAVDHFEQMKAELATLKARAQWQPIETAPKDGNRVLLWNRDWAAPFAGQFYGEAAGGWRLDYRIAPFTHQPTHWMPLPPAPAEQGEE